MLTRSEKTELLNSCEQLAQALLDDTDRWSERRQEAMREVEAPESALEREMWWRRMTAGGSVDL